MPRVFLSLGSNVEPETNLRLGVRELKVGHAPLRLSPVYRNKAVGFEGDDFLNMVVAFDTPRPIEEVVADIDRIHRLAGRRRGEQNFAPRTLDIDLLLYGDLVTDGPPVRLPRRDILEYNFVLKPLADIAPGALHPVTGRRFDEHWRDMDPGANPLVPVAIDFDGAGA